jgi:hypothetical protein
MNVRRSLSVLLALAACASASQAADWITAPSFYTHDPYSGERVQQYTQIGPFYTHPRGDFRRSGYRNTRSSIQVGGSADNYHLVEEWGGDVRPYGEWRLPYRPYSVPHHLWNSPYAHNSGPRGQGFGPGAGLIGRGRYPGIAPEYATPGPGPAPTGPIAPQSRPYPGYRPRPSDDGRYPPFDDDGPYGYPDLLQRTPPARPRL